MANIPNWKKLINLRLKEMSPVQTGLITQFYPNVLVLDLVYAIIDQCHHIFFPIGILVDNE